MFLPILDLVSVGREPVDEHPIPGLVGSQVVVKFSFFPRFEIHKSVISACPQKSSVLDILGKISMIQARPTFGFAVSVDKIVIIAVPMLFSAHDPAGPACCRRKPPESWRRWRDTILISSSWFFILVVINSFISYDKGRGLIPFSRKSPTIACKRNTKIPSIFCPP